MTTKWIVSHIGCIECHCPSGIVGIFTNEEKAEEVASKCNEKRSWLNGGQNSFEVFECPEDNVIHTDYE